MAIPASVVLDNLAAGLTVEGLIQSYPTLTREGIQACVAYAAELARERLVSLGRTRQVRFKVDENLPVEMPTCKGARIAPNSAIHSTMGAEDIAPASVLWFR